MLSKLKSLIYNHQVNVRQKELFKKHSFKDPLALNIDWDLLYHSKLKATGVQLKFNKGGQIKFAYPWEDHIFGLIWIILGTLMISATFVPSLHLFMDDPLNAIGHGLREMVQHWENDVLFSWVVGAGAIWLGVYIIKRTKIVQRFFQESHQYVNGTSVFDYHDIHAVQYIRDFNRADKLTYQINLVLNNGQRVPVIRARRSLAWQRQGKKLAKSLNVPFWTLED